MLPALVPVCMWRGLGCVTVAQWREQLQALVGGVTNDSNVARTEGGAPWAGAAAGATRMGGAHVTEGVEGVDGVDGVNFRHEGHKGDRSPRGTRVGLHSFII